MKNWKTKLAILFVRISDALSNNRPSFGMREQSPQMYRAIKFSGAACAVLLLAIFLAAKIGA